FEIELPLKLRELITEDHMKLPRYLSLTISLPILEYSALSRQKSESCEYKWILKNIRS
ncbi:hypothetical protein BgiMline_010927, partial [Biomphalaria glabrata]